MAKPNSKDTFKDYCLRQLGAPVIEVNIDDDQLDDRVDEALQYYQEYHTDGTERFFLKHKSTGSVLAFTGLSGTFVVNEEVTGGTSGAKMIVDSIVGSTLVYKVLGDPNVAFQANETITGGTSGASAQISSITIGDFEHGLTSHSRLYGQNLSLPRASPLGLGAELIKVRIQNTTKTRNISLETLHTFLDRLNCDVLDQTTVHDSVHHDVIRKFFRSQFHLQILSQHFRDRDLSVPKTLICH